MLRGHAILLALVEHLLVNGMIDATDVILTGCSGKQKVCTTQTL